VSNYRRVVTLEDNVVAGGFGSAVLEHLSGSEVSSKVSVIGIPDRFLPAGTVDDLLQELGLDVDSLVGRVALLLGE
jgi:1-deoxy-D-xylulose-5-phosphate synthase